MKADESKYLFKSERLGFRNWYPSDIKPMFEISSNEEVMEFFPYVATLEQTTVFISKMQSMLSSKGYCYFAVDELKSSKMIGFIGLCEQTFEADFTPCIDIGWRLDKDFWGKGYATEGAKECLSYAFNVLDLKKIKATAPLLNTNSINVMKKIGMNKHMAFSHPNIPKDNSLSHCICYEITKP